MNRIISEATWERCLMLAKDQRMQYEESWEIIKDLESAPLATALDLTGIDRYSEYDFGLWKTIEGDWVKFSDLANIHNAGQVSYDDIPDDQLIGILTARWKLKRDFRDFAGPFIGAMNAGQVGEFDYQAFINGVEAFDWCDSDILRDIKSAMGTAKWVSGSTQLPTVPQPVHGVPTIEELVSVIEGSSGFVHQTDVHKLATKIHTMLLNRHEGRS